MRQAFARREVLDDATRLRPFLVAAHGRRAPAVPLVERPPAGAVRVGVILIAAPPYAVRRPLQPAPVTAVDGVLPVVDAEVDEGDENDAAVPYRALLPEPGVWRIVRWGDFKSMLAPQVSHADRLHDTHRVPCYAQVYEMTRPQRVEALALALLGARERAAQMRPLTPDVAARLELLPLLAPRPVGAPRQRPEPGVLMPAERVVRLQVASDPTRPVPVHERPAGAFGREPDGGVTAAAATPRSEIPERWLRPWEFHLSREEAVYDMQAAVPRFPMLAACLRRLAGVFRRGDDFAKWQALLAGKSRDEQLWTVRPPRGGLSHPAVRDWAVRVLELAGYDPRTMLAEWEIFWRRKRL